MSSAPNQDSAAKAMLQASSAMAQGASQVLSPQQKKDGPVAPGELELSAWGAGSKELLALQQEWMERQAQVWLGMLDSPAAKPTPQAAKPEADGKPVDQPASAKPPIIDYLRESYLVNAECLKRAAEVVPVPEPTKEQIRHVTREVVDAMAPSKIFATLAETTTSNYQEIRDELKSGDIIVACKGNMQSFNGLISLFIRIVTASSYSHVGVVVKLGNRCFVVEATPPVVRLYPLSKLDSFYVIKMEQALSREDENRLFEYVGMPYSDWNSVASYFTGKPLANGKLQCAQLVSSFYNWPNLLRPEQIVRYAQETLGKRMVFVP